MQFVIQLDGNKIFFLVILILLLLLIILIVILVKFFKNGKDFTITKSSFSVSFYESNIEPNPKYDKNVTVKKRRSKNDLTLEEFRTIIEKDLYTHILLTSHDLKVFEVIKNTCISDNGVANNEKWYQSTETWFNLEQYFDIKFKALKKLYKSYEIYIKGMEMNK